MSNNIPVWLTNLALDIYKVIQQYDAIQRFQEMVQKWAEAHKDEIEKQKEWEERRSQHFEKIISDDDRLQNEQAGPPKEGWQWETSIVFTYEKTKSGLRRTANPISGWVPPDLSYSSKPEITRIFPLGRDHELTLEEKYTCLAAIYDYGRKGTAKLPPWQWPDLSLEQPKGALSDAKKCLIFECLCDSTSKIKPNDKGWLKALLNDVETDVSNWSGVEPPQHKKNMKTVSSETRTDRWIRWGKNHPLISILIIICIVIIALGTVTGKVETILSFVSKRVLKQSDSRLTQQDIMDTRILTATASVQINISSEEQINTRYPVGGARLAFGKDKEALLLLSSGESRAKQTGEGEVSYSSTLHMEPMDRAFNQPMSLLEQAEYVQISFETILQDSQVVSGKVTCIFNNTVPVEITVPSQKMRGNLIMIYDLKSFFAKLKEHKEED